MEPTVRAGSMQGFEPLVRSLGHDPHPLLARCGLSSALLGDEDARVPLQAAFDLMALGVAQTGLQGFGLRAAQIQDISTLGPLALAMQHCPTVGQSLDYLTRYLHVQSPALSMTVHRRDTLLPVTVELRYDPTGGGCLRACPQVHDHGIALAHSVLCLLAGERYALRAVSLPHSAGGARHIYENHFGVPVHTGRPQAALHLDVSIMLAPVVAAKATLLKIASDYLDRHHPRPTTELTPRVRLALSHSLANRFMDKAAVAGMLAMHPRTLQRRLLNEGTSFEAIRDAVRQEATLRYLADTSYSMAQIAGMVGFSEQSTFTRYCREKLNGTPGRLRQQLTRRAQ